MTNLPPAVEAALLEASIASNTQLRIETVINHLINSGEQPSAEYYAGLARARAANQEARASLHKAISRGGEQLEPEPPSWIPTNPDVHAQERRGRG